MAEWIEYPPELQGENEERIRQIHRYLRTMAETLNKNQGITDENLSEYISQQTQALRKISGAKQTGAGATDIRDLTTELVKTLQEMLTNLQTVNSDAVTSTRFTTLWIEKARTTPVIPAGGSTGIILATGIKDLQDAQSTDEAEIAKIRDQTGETISDNWHGFLYSGVIGTDNSNNPIYGTAIGKDVVTWNGGTPTYNASNAWAIFSAGGNKSGGSIIATASDVNAKADKYAAATTETTETDADQFTSPGKWFIEIDTANQTNFPTGLTDGEEILLETIGDGQGNAMQRIFASGMIFTRMSSGNSWGQWHSFSGSPQ